MNDTVFRSKVAPQTETQTSKPVKPSEGEIPSSQEIPPYLDYENINHKPYSVDYFQIGDRWNDPLGGFPKEIALIEEYFRHRIETGEMANSTNAVKEELKKIEKLNNLVKEERKVMKIETVAAYIEFLMKTDDIKFNIKRYAYP